MKQLRFKLNGKKEEVMVEEGLRLVDLLRNRFGLCGAKISCEQGECGACTVLLDNQAVHSCLILAVQTEGCEVITVEGLEKDGKLDPVQEAFMECGAIQCGFCTPGMIMSAKGLLLNNPKPTDKEIKEALEGNLCRCTGYTKILQAVRLAAERSGSQC